MKRLLSATMIAVALLACAADAANARPGRANALATRAYLKARYVEVHTNGPAYREGIKAIEQLAARVQVECRGALASAPNLQSTSEKEVLAEVFAVVLRAPERAEHAAAVKFARSVRRLHWSNRQLTLLTHSDAQRRAVQSGIAPPNLCADLKAWAASGYTATSAATKSYLHRLSAADALQPGARAGEAQKRIKRMLARYEDRSSKAVVRRTKALEAQQRYALKAFPEATGKVTQALHASS